MPTIPQPVSAAAKTSFPPQRILVPMDLTDAAMAGWACAKSFSRRFGSQLEAFYVQPWLFSVAGMGVVEPYLSTEVERDAVAELQRRLGPEAVVVGDIGSVEPSILAKSGAFDLLVVGTHARTGIARALSGSIAEALMRDSRKPVLVARGPLDVVKTVLAPVNFEPHSWSAFELAARAAVALGASLTALHVVDQGLARGAEVASPMHLLDEWISRLPEGLGPKCAARGRLEFGSAAEGIAGAAADAQLVVLAAHRKGLLADAFGTTAERVLRHCEIPVLAVPSGVK